MGEMRKMKKSLKLVVYYVTAFVVILLNVIFFISDQFFYSLEDLPSKEGQTAVFSALSPDNKKTAKCYSVNTPKGPAVLVELITHDMETNIEKQENIYWEVGKERVMIGWVDENTIIIDSKTLDLSKNQTFDSRRVVSLRGK